MDRKTEVGEALKPPLVTDTADSGKTHPHTSHGSPRKPDMLDAANATPLPPEREDLQPASSGQTSAAGKLGGDISDMSPTQLFQDDKPGPTQKQVEKLVCLSCHMTCNIIWCRSCLSCKHVKKKAALL